VKLLEYLVSDEAQAIYAKVDYEYPIKAGAQIDPIIASFGALRPDSVPLTEIAKHRRAASLLAERIGFDN
jgi:iron(III) transport system substrate-binding protein